MTVKALRHSRLSLHGVCKAKMAVTFLERCIRHQQVVLLKLFAARNHAIPQTSNKHAVSVPTFCPDSSATHTLGYSTAQVQGT